MEFEEPKLTDYEANSSDDGAETPASIVPLHIRRQISLEKSQLDLKPAELIKLINEANIEKTEAEMREAERNYKVIDVPCATPTPLVILNPEECKTSET